MSKRILRGSRVVVTGASSGIGRELALELSRRGAVVCALARRERELLALVDEMNAIRMKNFASFPVHFCVVGDVCESDVRERAIAETVERFGGLDILVNNAGAGATIPAEDTSDDLACELFDLNFFSPFELTKLALPSLKKSASSNENREKGIRPLVINLSSIVGLRGTPYYGVYGASKAALLTLTDAWRAELSCEGVDFLTVMPGTTSSQFFDVLLRDVRRPNFPNHRPALPKDVALAIANAAEQGRKRLVPVSRSAKLLYFLSRYFPGLTDTLMNQYSSQV